MPRDANIVEPYRGIVALGILHGNTFIDDPSVSSRSPQRIAEQLRGRRDVIEQRRREFFLDGHHLGDYIRFSLPFNPPPGTAYHAGGVYGSNRCLPLPDVEKANNPNF